ncbi:hypothetical protein KVV02_001691 [Mortierella alpina]|uniref:Uncharacterized protein n=1 Tax=Mortierella alpina TaxID=64518 RepID=A0A9P8A602_MORAP|nr:hypothetical protein KVV02_001691 [Mortierella alpina]
MATFYSLAFVFSCEDMKMKPNEIQPSAALAIAQDHYNALATGVLFEGVNTADPDADKVGVFRDYRNHADAVASILLYCAEETSFHPAGGRSDTPEAYFDFIQKAASFPAFYFLGTEDRQYTLDLNGDREQFLDQVTEKYRLESTFADPDRIRSSFQTLVPRTIDHPSKRSWLLSLITLNKQMGTDNVTFSMAHVRLTMSRDEKSGIATIDRQAASMTLSCYSVMGRYISFYSDELARYIEKGSVDQLIRTLSSSKSQSGAAKGASKGMVQDTFALL